MISLGPAPEPPKPLTPDSFFPDVPENAKWTLVFKRIGVNLLEALKRQNAWRMAALQLGTMTATAVEYEFARKCVVVLGGYLAMARALFTLRMALKQPPRFGLIQGSAEYYLAKLNNCLNCYYVFERYEGRAPGRLGPAERPFVHVLCKNVAVNGVLVSSEHMPKRTEHLACRIDRHYRAWRRSLIRASIIYVNMKASSLFGGFALFVRDYDF